MKAIAFLNVRLDNVLSSNDENFVNIPTNLEETGINISHINENSNDMNNTELGGSFTTNSITIDERSINRAISTEEGVLVGSFVLTPFLILAIKFLQKRVRERVRFCSRLKNS